MSSARIDRLIVWAGGAAFVVALAGCAWLYLVPLGVHRPLSTAAARAFAVDAALVGVFAAHHSVFARARVKAMVVRVVPAPLLRSFYVWIASLLLIAVVVWWQPIGGELYEARGVQAVVHALVQLTGVWLTVRSVRRIDPLELAGIRAGVADVPLQTTGPYGLVRHPLYLGWLLMVFGAAHMTGDRLTFAAITSLYLVVAIPWEERSLVAAYGDAYAAYMRQVRWRVIPYVY